MLFRSGVLGGTFDPIHNGHLDLASAAHAALDLTHVLVIPANVPPHRPRPQASRFHRFAMVALAVAGRAGWQASDMELGIDAPSYTTTTLLQFHDQGYAATEIFFVIGADAFGEIATWRGYPNILDRAHFVVVSRPGCSVGQLRDRLPALIPRMVEPSRGGALPDTPSIILLDAQTADVSSTEIRRRVAAGDTIDGMVDPRVRQHIVQHGLYRPTAHDHRHDRGQARSTADRLHGQD